MRSILNKLSLTKALESLRVCLINQEINSAECGWKNTVRRTKIKYELEMYRRNHEAYIDRLKKQTLLEVLIPRIVDQLFRR